MAIEPIGSMTVIQAQTTQKAPEVRPAAENTEVFTAEQKATVDPATVNVARTERKDEQNENASGKEREQQPNADKIKKAVEQLNRNMTHSEAIFGIHEATNRVTIKIVDKDTKEVIKELPPEKTLDMIAKVWELAGMLVDEKR